MASRGVMNTSYFKVTGSTRGVRPVYDETGVTDPKTKAERVMAHRPMIIDFSRFFFFDEHDPASILRAWEGARALTSAACIATYRPVPVTGPWSSARLVGESNLGSN